MQTFHQHFAHALANPDTDSDPLLKAGASARRRFDIYRNNRVASLIDALRQSYPATAQLVGEEFFKASARAFVDAHPPTQPVMAEYGREFGQFVASLPNTSVLPYLQDVAELEWWRLQAYHSADAPVLSVAVLAEIPPQQLMQIRLQGHPALYLIQSQWPIGSIWTNSVSARDAAAPVNLQQPQAVVITRPELQVQVNLVEQAAAAFLQALQQSAELGVAAEQALAVDDTFDAGANLAGLISLGAFCGYSDP